MEEPVLCGRGRDTEDRRRLDGRSDRRTNPPRGMKDGGERERVNKRKGGSVNGSEKQSETYELILIGGDSGEYGLREYEGLVRLLLEVHDRLRRARVWPLHQVDSRLILVHRVQHQLQIVPTYNTSRVDIRIMEGYTFANKRAEPGERSIFQIDASPFPILAQGWGAGKHFKHSMCIFIFSDTSDICLLSYMYLKYVIHYS